MQKLPYLIARCSLPHCNRQAAWIGTSGFKLCDLHKQMLQVGEIISERMRQRREFNLDAVGELDESGNVRKR